MQGSTGFPSGHLVYLFDRCALLLWVDLFWSPLSCSCRQCCTDHGVQLWIATIYLRSFFIFVQEFISRRALPVSLSHSWSFLCWTQTWHFILRLICKSVERIQTFGTVALKHLEITSMFLANNFVSTWPCQWQSPERGLRRRWMKHGDDSSWRGIRLSRDTPGNKIAK